MHGAIGPVMATPPPIFSDRKQRAGEFRKMKRVTAPLGSPTPVFPQGLLAIVHLLPSSAPNL